MYENQKRAPIDLQVAIPEIITEVPVDVPVVTSFIEPTISPVIEPISVVSKQLDLVTKPTDTVMDIPKKTAYIVLGILGLYLFVRD
jgi:hypothetical protein